MYTKIGVILIYIHELGASNSTNNAASSKNNGDFEKALITSCVVVGIILISLVVAKVLDFIYDQQTIRDDASDISEHTRNLIKMRLALSKFGRKNKSPSGSNSSKQGDTNTNSRVKRMFGFWSSKTREHSEGENVKTVHNPANTVVEMSNEKEGVEPIPILLPDKDKVKIGDTKWVSFCGISRIVSPSETQNGHTTIKIHVEDHDEMQKRTKYEQQKTEKQGVEDLENNHDTPKDVSTENEARKEVDKKQEVTNKNQNVTINTTQKLTNKKDQESNKKQQQMTNKNQELNNTKHESVNKKQDQSDSGDRKQELTDKTEKVTNKKQESTEKTNISHDTPKKQINGRVTSAKSNDKIISSKSAPIKDNETKTTKTKENLDKKINKEEPVKAVTAHRAASTDNGSGITKVETTEKETGKKYVHFQDDPGEDLIIPIHTDEKSPKFNERYEPQKNEKESGSSSSREYEFLSQKTPSRPKSAQRPKSAAQTSKSAVSKIHKNASK